ncbi:MAG: magnesium-translocating P-type ATPase [Caulobacteraceae bacterium]|nr:magnesium-translocating P-type ATPase [Caulobacteraceae bacterium]
MIQRIPAGRPDSQNRGVGRVRAEVAKGQRMNAPDTAHKTQGGPKPGRRVPGAKGTAAPLAGDLAAIAALDAPAALTAAHGETEGLDPDQVAERLKQYGPNTIAREGRPSILAELWGRAMNPLNALLLVLAAVSYLLSDPRSAIVIALMVVLSIGLGFVQEHRSNNAAAKLATMVRTRASVKRRGDPGHPPTPGAPADEGFFEVPLDQLVPGDIVRLSAGDMIPADVRLLDAKGLYVNQAALTGESMPVEKAAERHEGPCEDPFGLANLCFMGSNVVSGYATAVVVHTGRRTYFGKLAGDIVGARELTSFDKGVSRFAWLMIRFILVMAPLVFLINGLTKGNWFEALMFAVAVAVGLTPEMLPMIVTVNLAQGALAMSRRKVIVKRLNAIQNFGAMDVLCTDKTGTLTQDRVIMKLHLGAAGHPDDRVLEYAYLNSHFQAGLKNLLDVAVLEHVEMEHKVSGDDGYAKLDEIPFDFTRRRLSVVVARPGEKPLLICKGAVEEVIAQCGRVRSDDDVTPLDAAHAKTAKTVTDRLNRNGFRVVAVACKTLEAPKAGYGVEDEADLVLQGFIAFLDPPKETAAAAIAELGRLGVSIKILTGDNDLVTHKICHDVGLKAGHIVLGAEVEAMSDEALAGIVEQTTVFAKVSPAQKARVIAALHRRDHVVGFLGDGINDGPALKAADVGVSVDTAVDIAKESADIILLDKSLAVLAQGAVEGRRVFGNITKYIKMGASSNFGNMFSVLGASLFLPFLPMLPIQVLTNNLLYDFSQTAIPTDRVDEEYLAVPRRWEIRNLLRFMLFIGPISSIFDYATYATMLFVFHAWNRPALFQTGWFVESLLTQTLIIHIIRTAKIPFIQSRASTALILTTLTVCAAAIALPFTPLGATLGFTPLPPLYWPIIGGFLLAYAVLTHLVKSWFIKRWGT